VEQAEKCRDCVGACRAREQSHGGASSKDGRTEYCGQVVGGGSRKCGRGGYAEFGFI
jgi:hypothetical protein